MTDFEMEAPQGEFLGNICPIDGAICDRKCGYPAHGTLKRAQQPIPANLSRDDDNICESCQG